MRKSCFGSLLPYFLLMVIVLLSAAKSDAQSGTHFIDGTGTRVSYYQDAGRIVTLAPNLTEMLHFVGLGSSQVARTDFCDYPEVVENLPSIGGFADTSLEAILAQRPDLVVAYQGNSLDLVANLRSAGIEVLAFKEALTLDEIHFQMETLLKVAGSKSSQPSKAFDTWNTRLAALTEPGYPAKGGPSFYFGYPSDKGYTCSSGTFVSDLIARCGMHNVVGDSNERWPQVSAEFILSARPDWIVTGTNCTSDEDAVLKRRETIAELSADPVWKLLPAVKAKRIAVVDADILLRPGPRVLDALQQLKKQTADAADSKAGAAAE